jgi:hypothetical protein
LVVCERFAHASECGTSFLPALRGNKGLIPDARVHVPFLSHAQQPCIALFAQRAFNSTHIVDTQYQYTASDRCFVWLLQCQRFLHFRPSVWRLRVAYTRTNGVPRSHAYRDYKQCPPVILPAVCYRSSYDRHPRNQPGTQLCVYRPSCEFVH